jgi:hypothetical protein
MEADNHARTELGEASGQRPTQPDSVGGSRVVKRAELSKVTPRAEGRSFRPQKNGCRRATAYVIEDSQELLAHLHVEGVVTSRPGQHDLTSAAAVEI